MHRDHQTATMATPPAPSSDTLLSGLMASRPTYTGLVGDADWCFVSWRSSLKTLCRLRMSTPCPSVFSFFLLYIVFFPSHLWHFISLYTVFFILEILFSEIDFHRLPTLPTVALLLCMGMILFQRSAGNLRDEWMLFFQYPVRYTFSRQHHPQAAILQFLLQPIIQLFSAEDGTG